jgi:predicted PurR-regulated permease PerM
MDQSRFYSRLFAVAALAALGYALLLIFQPFLVPILWALLIAFLLYPVNVHLRLRFKGKSGAAAGVLMLLVTIGMAAPAVILTMVFAGQAADLAARLSAAAARYEIARPSDVFRIPALGTLLQWIEARVPLTADQLQGWLLQGSQRALRFLAASTGTVVLSALGAIVRIVLMLFVLFFFLRDGDTMADRFVRVLPMPPERKTHLTQYLASVTRAIVFGTLLTAILQGTLVGIGFGLTHLPSPVVFGAIAAACSLLPVGGTALVWGPGAIALAVQGRWGAAVFLAAWGAILVSTVDNVLRPLFISGRAQISTLPIFFGVLGGLAAFGPIGMFLGPLLVALALALLGFAEEATKEAREVEGGRT